MLKVSTKKIAFIHVQCRQGQEHLPSLFQDDPAAWGEYVSVYVFSASAKQLVFDEVIAFTPDLPFRGFDTVLLSIPVEWLHFRILKMPFADRAKLKKVIPFEIEGLILHPAHDIIFDFTILNNAESSSDILVAYMKNDSFKGILDRLAQSGIDPAVVTCLELQGIAGKGIPDIAQHLMHPEPPETDKLVETIHHEILSPAINLRGGDFVFKKDAETVWKSLKVTAMLMIAIAILLHGIFGIRTVIATRAAASIEQEMRKVYTSLFPQEKKIADELYQLKSHMREVREKGDAMIGVRPLEFLKSLSRKNSTGVLFTEITLSRDIVTLKGEAASMEAIERTKAVVSEFIGSISTSDIKTAADGKVSFTMVGKGKKQ